MGTLKLQSNGPIYSNTLIGTLAVDEWAVTFGTARRGLGKLRSRLRCTKCNSPSINGQCTNFILFDVALKLPLYSRGLTGTVKQKQKRREKVAAFQQHEHRLSTA